MDVGMDRLLVSRLFHQNANPHKMASLNRILLLVIIASSIASNNTQQFKKNINHQSRHGQRSEQQLRPVEGRDFEAKVMIFHDNQNDQMKNAQYDPFVNKHLVAPPPPPLGHPASEKDIINEIVSGILKRKPTEEELEEAKEKVDEAALEDLHEHLFIEEKQRERAHELLLEMRHAKAEKKKQQARLRKQLQQADEKPQKQRKKHNYGNSNRLNRR